MEWLAGLDVRMVLIIVGALLVARVGIARGLSRRLPRLFCGTLMECTEIGLVSVVIVFLVLQRFLFQLFFIPSESMVPTLVVQDHIFVNKWAYRLHPPHRGDVVVFHAPPAATPEPKEFVKRVVGLPGETVSVTPDTLCLDGQPLISIILASEATTARDGLLVGDGAPVRLEGNRVLVSDQLAVIATPDGQAQQVGRELVVEGQVIWKLMPGETVRQRPLRREADGIGIGMEGCVVTTAARPRLVVVKGNSLSLRPGCVYVNGRPIPEVNPRETPRYAMAPVRLGADQYLVLGDNRNNSRDSHFWGALDGTRIVGRADAIYWPPQRACWLDDRHRNL